MATLLSAPSATPQVRLVYMTRRTFVIVAVQVMSVSSSTQASPIKAGDTAPQVIDEDVELQKRIEQLKQSCIKAIGSEKFDVVYTGLKGRGRQVWRCAYRCLRRCDGACRSRATRTSF